MDVTEAYELGMSAHMRSADPAFNRPGGGHPARRGHAAEGRYNARFFAAPASEFANHVRRFPAEWILNTRSVCVTEEALAYFRPLIEGEPKLVMEGGLPVTLPAFNRR